MVADEFIFLFADGRDVLSFSRGFLFFQTCQCHQIRLHRCSFASQPEFAHVRKLRISLRYLNLHGFTSQTFTTCDFIRAEIELRSFIFERNETADDFIECRNHSAEILTIHTHTLIARVFGIFRGLIISNLLRRCALLRYHLFSMIAFNEGHWAVGFIHADEFTTLCGRKFSDAVIDHSLPAIRRHFAGCKLRIALILEFFQFINDRHAGRIRVNFLITFIQQHRLQLPRREVIELLTDLTICNFILCLLLHKPRFDHFSPLRLSPDLQRILVEFATKPRNFTLSMHRRCLELNSKTSGFRRMIFKRCKPIEFGLRFSADLFASNRIQFSILRRCDLQQLRMRILGSIPTISGVHEAVCEILVRASDLINSSLIFLRGFRCNSLSERNSNSSSLRCRLRSLSFCRRGILFIIVGLVSR